MDGVLAAFASPIACGLSQKVELSNQRWREAATLAEQSLEEMVLGLVGFWWEGGEIGSAFSLLLM